MITTTITILDRSYLGEAYDMFTDVSATIEQLKGFNGKQNQTIIWIFSGRFYFKYSELRGKGNLSEEELVRIIPPSGESVVVRPEDIQDNTYSVQALGLDKLGEDVLSLVKQKHPNKNILILFITDSFIAAPDFKIDETTKQVNVSTLSLTQKNIFFKQYGLDSETKKRINQFFHRSYLDELDKLDNTNDTGKRNNWLKDTTKDLIVLVDNNTHALEELPTSPRERAYAYALEKAKYNPASIVGYDEFKPGGYRYNYNALYNAKSYIPDDRGSGVVADAPISGVKCAPNYIYAETDAIRGIININATEPPCTRVTADKLIQHYVERSFNTLSEQIANAVEFSLTAEAKLALDGQTQLQSTLFQARKDLLLHLIRASSPEDQYMYAYSNEPFNLKDLTFRQGTRQLIIKPKPVTGPASPTPTNQSPSPGPTMLRMNVLLAVASILDETKQAGQNAYMLNKSVELLFNLFKALDDVSSALDFDVLKHYRLIEPSQNDKELLKQLRYLYENDRGSLTKEELELYFWLLCFIEFDCSNYNIIELNTINKELKGQEHP